MQVLGTRRPGVVARQEVTARTVASYREQPARIGLPHAADSFALAPDRSVLTGPRRYDQVTASRWPLRALAHAAFPVPWTERVLSVLVASPWGELEVHTAHVPPGASHGWLKIDTLEGIYRRLAQVSPLPRVLCGDFNTPREERESGEVITWGQTKAADGAYATPRGTERWDRGERSVLLGLGRYDLPDVYRLLHGYGAHEFSW